MNSKLQKISILNLTKFKDISIDFSNGINVLIGENGTGKTHLLKVIYSFLKSSEKYSDFGHDLHKKLNNVFQANGIENLITQNQENEANVSFFIQNNSFSFSIFTKEDPAISKNERSYKKLSYTNNIEQLKNYKPLFIPPHEIITTYVELLDWLERFEHHFEELYLDLAKSMLHTRTQEIGELQNVHDRIIDIIQGKVLLDKTEFYIEYENMKIRATMLAEGIKKFILLEHLIKNQSLTRDTILFLDEPEVHLNPKYITKFTELLIDLANHGVQIFIATHDYLFIHQLSLMHEYRKAIEEQGKHVPEIRFHSLYTNKRNFTEVESSEKLTGINHNSILDEFTALYDSEQKLFNLTIK